MVHVTAIHRYPVKGLSPQVLTHVRAVAGETLPYDRQWAIENGGSKFDPAQPVHQPKIAYLMLMRNERLAALCTSFDETTSVLTVSDQHGKEVATGSLDAAAGRQDLERFFGHYCADELRGQPRIVSAAGHAFTDMPRKCLSVINLATVRDLGDRLGIQLDPLRFRGNVMIDGAPPWQEFEWIGQPLRIGPVAVDAFARTNRCAATNVDPDSGRRDLALPKSLLTEYGHSDLGIYVSVTSGGVITVGDRVEPQGAS